MIVRRSFGEAGEASIEFLEGHDFAADSYAPADGSGGEAVCAVLLRHCSITSPRDVDVSLRVKVIVRMKCAELEKHLSRPNVREQTYARFKSMLQAEEWCIPEGGFRWSEADRDLLTMAWYPTAREQ
jgi:hypothetical protein